MGAGEAGEGAFGEDGDEDARAEEPIGEALLPDLHPGAKLCAAPPARGVDSLPFLNMPGTPLDSPVDSPLYFLLGSPLSGEVLGVRPRSRLRRGEAPPATSRTDALFLSVSNKK